MNDSKSGSSADRQAKVAAPSTHSPEPAVEENQRVRYRIRFGKIDLLRWISHRDLARLWERLGRRVGLDFSMTEGFHPKPRISFPSALALGVQSDDEVVEIELRREIDAHELLVRMQSDAQPGLPIHSVTRMPDGFGKAKVQRTEYLVTMPDIIDRGDLADRIPNVAATKSHIVRRKKKDVTLHPSEMIQTLELRNDQLFMALKASDGAAIRPEDVLDMLGIEDLTAVGGTLRRTAVVLENEFLPNHDSAPAPRDSVSSSIAAASAETRLAASGGEVNLENPSS